MLGRGGQDTVANTVGVETMITDDPVIIEKGIDAMTGKRYEIGTSICEETMDAERIIEGAHRRPVAMAVEMDRSMVIPLSTEMFIVTEMIRKKKRASECQYLQGIVLFLRRLSVKLSHLLQNM